MSEELVPVTQPASDGESEVSSDIEDTPDAATVIADTDHKIDWVVPAPPKPGRLSKARQERQLKFLGAYAANGTISGASRAAGVSTTTTVRWRKEDPWFRERFREAEQVYKDFLQDMVHDRVIHGIEQPIVGKRLGPEGVLEDDIIGTKRIYSDNLTMFHVKRHIPQYKDNYSEPQEDKTVRSTVSVLDRIKQRLQEKADRAVIDVAALPAHDKEEKVSEEQVSGEQPSQDESQSVEETGS